MENQEYDLVVMGAGSGGMAAAKKASRNGARVAVIESRTVGGTCVARGCMPKKFLVIASEKARDSQSPGPRGLSSRLNGTDWSELIEHEQAVVDDLIDLNRDGLVDYDGVTLIEGIAHFIDDRSIEVKDRTIGFEKAVIATGLRPARPPIEGAELGLTSDEFLQHPELPDSVVFVGGGYIGVEFASILEAFGVEVQILHRPPHLIKQHDSDVADFLADQFRDRELEVKTEAEVQAIREQKDGYEVEYTHRGNTYTSESEQVIIATGRRPNVEDIGLEDAGVELDGSGFVEVDDRFRTTNESIYAVGDVIGKAQYTPVAIREGKIAADHAFGDGEDRIDYDTVPTAVFSHPTIGSVGLSEEEARSRHSDSVVVASKQFTPYSATVKGTTDKTFIKVIFGKENRALLGLHVCGPHASEIVQGFALAMKTGATQDDLKDFPGVHPTVAEEIFSAKP